MTAPRFSILLRPYDPEDRRLDDLTQRATANSIHLGDGEISAVTFLFRCELDTLAGSGATGVFLHTNIPLTKTGQNKLEELHELLRIGIQKAFAALPETVPLLADNVFWVTVDVRRDGGAQDAATFLCDFDFTRAQRAVDGQAATHKSTYTGLWAGIRAWSRSFAAKQEESLRAFLDGAGRKGPADAAAKLHNAIGAVTFRQAIESNVAPTLARIFAANLSLDQRRIIAERGRNAGRMTQFRMEDGVVATPVEPEPPRLATQFVEDAPDIPLLTLPEPPRSPQEHVVEPRRPTLVNPDEDLPTNEAHPPGPPPFIGKAMVVIPQDPIIPASGADLPELPRGLRVARVDRTKPRPPG